MASPGSQNPDRRVQVWSNRVRARDAGDAVANWWFQVARPFRSVSGNAFVSAIFSSTWPRPAPADRDPNINRALAAFRRFDGRIRFGQNLLCREEGRLALGDVVEIVA